MALAVKGQAGSSVCLPQEKMLDIYWLLRVCLKTIEHGDRTGSLFAFMPEFYLSAAINTYSALKNYFGPVHSMEELPGDGAVSPGGLHREPWQHGAGEAAHTRPCPRTATTDWSSLQVP